VGGSVLAQGILDSKGQARASLPVGIEESEVYFRQDPDGKPYYDPDEKQPVQEPEAGIFRENLFGYPILTGKILELAEH
jgi:hypothetical protein